MSFQAVRYVMERSRSTGSMRLVLLALAEKVRAPDKEHAWCAWYKPEEYAAHANVSLRTAQDCLHGLAGYGPRALEIPEIDIVAHGAPLPAARPQHRPNLYRIIVASGADPRGLVVQDQEASGAGSRAERASSGATSEPFSQLAGPQPSVIEPSGEPSSRAHAFACDESDEIADAEIVPAALTGLATLYTRANIGRTRRIDCPGCGGHGMRWVTDDAMATCEDCGGAGYVDVELAS